MATPEGKVTPDFWQAESLRFTVFFPTAIPVQSSVLWWDQIIGSPPDIRLERIREGVIRQDASLGGMKVTLNVTPPRVDLIFTVDPQIPRDDSAGISVIGPFADREAQLSDYVGRFMDLKIDIARIAFGAVLIRPVERREEGYEILTKLLPSIRLDIENSRDFFYQINRPKESKVIPPGKINRLSKWSVVQVQPMIIQMSSGQDGNTLSQFLEEGSSGVRLEIDLSTPADNLSALPHDRIKPVWAELVGLSHDIAMRGDEPNA